MVKSRVSMCEVQFIIGKKEGYNILLWDVPLSSLDGPECRRVVEFLDRKSLTFSESVEASYALVQAQIDEPEIINEIFDFARIVPPMDISLLE